MYLLLSTALAPKRKFRRIEPILNHLTQWLQHMSSDHFFVSGMFNVQLIEILKIPRGNHVHNLTYVDESVLTRRDTVTLDSGQTPTPLYVTSTYKLPPTPSVSSSGL